MKYIKLEKADKSAKYVHGMTIAHGYELESDDSFYLKPDLRHLIVNNLLSELWQPKYDTINDGIEPYMYETH